MGDKAQARRLGRAWRAVELGGHITVFVHLDVLGAQLLQFLAEKRRHRQLLFIGGGDLFSVRIAGRVYLHIAKEALDHIAYVGALGYLRCVHDTNLLIKEGPPRAGRALLSLAMRSVSLESAQGPT